MGKALDALGGHWSEEGGEEGGERAVQRGKRGGFTPQLLIQDAAIATGRIRGLGGAVVKS